MGWNTNVGFWLKIYIVFFWQYITYLTPYPMKTPGQLITVLQSLPRRRGRHVCVVLRNPAIDGNIYQWYSISWWMYNHVISHTLYSLRPNVLIYNKSFTWTFLVVMAIGVSTREPGSSKVWDNLASNVCCLRRYRMWQSRRRPGKAFYGHWRSTWASPAPASWRTPPPHFGNPGSHLPPHHGSPPATACMH